MARAAARGFPALIARLADVPWLMVLTTALIAGVGAAMLYSVAGGTFEPLASAHLMRFGLAFTLLMAVGLTHIRVWWTMAYAAYAVALGLLIGVEFIGETGGGAQRWINLGFMNLQPSEVMKIALVLALARYYHGRTMAECQTYSSLLVPLLLIAAPVALVLRQPDLGTAMLLIMGGAGVMFLAGVRIRLFIISAILVIVAIPVGLNQLHDYQRQRVLTFLDPSSDPLGAGYHIQQSKIALGSGGVSGKGFMQGTQAHLDFLPEKQTDFIFTMLAEEFGFIGGVALLGLYALLIIYGYVIGLSARNQFARLLALGVTLTFFLYVFINIAMVMGLIPVVGVPLPLVSYGGSAMLTLMGGLGLMISAYIDRDVTISRQGSIR